MRITILVASQDGSHRRVNIFGRNAWALVELVQAGREGCTPLTHPGPRWSAYVHRLRQDHGLDIQTVYETHKGAFPGSHARYVLRSKCQVLSIDRKAA
jgi:hypothetical protein